MNPTIDPLARAASALMKMHKVDDPSLTHERATRDLMTQADLVDLENFGLFDAMLMAQSHMLHAMFCDAVERYAEAGDDDARKYHAAQALKIQSQCRQTVTEFCRHKKTRNVEKAGRPFSRAHQEELRKQFSPDNPRYRLPEEPQPSAETLEYPQRAAANGVLSSP